MMLLGGISKIIHFSYTISPLVTLPPGQKPIKSDHGQKLQPSSAATAPKTALNVANQSVLEADTLDNRLVLGSLLWILCSMLKILRLWLNY